MKISYFLAAATWAVCTFSATAQNAVKVPSGIEKKASVEGITEYHLTKNGLRILLFPDASKSTMTVNMTYLVGSKHEGLGETGMAHLLEHMVFKGSPRHTNIPKELNEHGGNFNGTTWLDRTNYFETFPASGENLEWALDLESDRMVNSFIAKKDLETEFSVVRNEFEAGENSPESVLMERVMSSAYLWHNYGKSTIGNRSDIENVPIENLQAFYRRFYQPDNAILLVAGKIDEGKTLELIDKYFSKIPKPTRILEKSWTVEPTQDGERQVSLRRVGDVQCVSAGYHICPGSHPDYASMEILTTILSDEPSGRLYKTLIEPKKAASMWGFSMSLKDPGFVYFNANVLKTQSLDETKGIFLKTLDDIANNPPTDEEINRARTKILKQFEETVRNSERLGVLMSEYIAQGDWRLGFIYRDNLKKLTSKDVARVAKTYFKPSNRTVGLFYPEATPDRTEVPQAPDVTALVHDYKGEKLMAQGEVFDPSPVNIEMRTKRTTEGGIKFSLLPKSTRGNTVNFNMTFRIGDEKSLAGQRMNLEFMVSMLQKGTKNKTQQQIKDALDNLKASLRVSNNANRIAFSGETVRENVPKVLALIAELVKESNFPEKEFEELRQASLAQIEQQRSDPMALASIAFSRLQNHPKNDVRYSPTIDEQVEDAKNVKLAEVKKFYEQFMGVTEGGCTVSMVGDFDENEAKKLIVKELGGFKAKSKYRMLDDKFQAAKPQNVEIPTPDKPNAMFLAGQPIQMKDDNPDYIALMLGNHVLGGGALSSRLADRIRQKEGISYGVGSFFNVKSTGDNGVLGAYAIYAPQNVERLEKAFKEEIEKIVKEGITEKELADAKKAVLQSNLVDRTQDNLLASKLGGFLILNRTMQWDADMEAKINKLTIDEVNAALKKYVDLSKMSMVKAGDFKKVAKP